MSTLFRMWDKFPDCAIQLQLTLAQFVQNARALQPGATIGNSLTQRGDGFCFDL